MGAVSKRVRSQVRRIGIHCSTAGSLERAGLKAHELGANALQIFSASPRMWRTKACDAEQVARMSGVRARYDLYPLVIHGSYLINLAAPPGELRQKSIDAFRGEMERAIVIGAEYLVIHPGSYRGLTSEQGAVNVAEGLIRASRTVDRTLRKNARLTVLLENTAGAGSQLGGKLEELATIRALSQSDMDTPVGYCLDTCHCYVAGFDIATEQGLAEFLSTAESTLGLCNVPVVHANDAKKALASHMDRHANIGAGYIGLEGFRRILNHPKLREKTFILETPVDAPGDDQVNVAALKELVSPREPLISPRSNKGGLTAGRKTRRSM